MPSQLQTISHAIRSRLLSFNSQTNHSTATAVADPAANAAFADAAVDDAPSGQSGLISPTNSDRPMLPFNSFDLESGGSAEATGNNTGNNTVNNTGNSTGNNTGEPTEGTREWKRTGKVVQTVGLGSIGVSVTLIVNAPPASDTHHALYTAYLSMVGLGLFTGMGLSFFSILMKGSPTVGWVQKRLIFFTLFFVAISCFLRLYFALPLKDVLIGSAVVVSGVTMMVIYLYVCRKYDRLEHEPGTEL